MTNKEKELRQEITVRMRRIRKALGRNQTRLAEGLGLVRQTYTRYETGKLVPGIYTLSLLAKRYNVSLDWLIADKGPMFFRLEPDSPPPLPEPPLEANPGPEIPKEELELLEHMAHIPLLRFQILAFFQQFKMDHKDLVETETAAI
jgi:transcriptional regulator with XRE-family HTH domain